MVSRKEWYTRVGAVLPEEKSHAVPSAEEAVRAARKLYRFVFRQTCPYKVIVTSGNRYSGVFSGEFHVNPNRKHPGERGWSALIHDLSHNFHWRMSNEKPHAKAHAKLELRMRKEVLKRGWLDGTLKREEPPPASEEDVRRAKYARVLQSIARWEAKAKRARTALVKLNRSKRGLERHLGA